MKRSPADAKTVGWLVLASLGLLSLAWRRLLLYGQIPIDGNMIAVTYPNWILARSLWLKPHLPFWNPLRNMGTPYLADPITSVLYPPQWLLTLMPDFMSFLNAWVVLHTLIAAGFTAALAYRWYKDKGAAAGAALLAAFNGFFMARVIFTHCFASQAWLPAALYFQDRGSPVALGICLALQWLAGYPTYSCLTVMACLGLAVTQGRAGIKIFLKAGVIAFGLSAVQFIPFLELLLHSSRRLVLDPALASQFSIPFAQLTKEVFMPQWNWLSPGLAGDPAMMYFYIGPVAVGLVLYALARGRARERRLGAAAALFLLLSMGKYIPGYRYLFFLHFFRSPNNWLLLASCSLALLGAAGIAQLKRNSWKWYAVGAIALDLMIFAQPSKSAWGKPEFLTTAPAVVQGLSHVPHPRIYHEEGLMQTWGQGTLESTDDYLLMMDFLAPSYGMAFGVGDIVNYQTLRLEAAERYRSRLAEVTAPSSLLDQAGASAIVSLDPKAPRVERGRLRVTLNPTAKPHIFLRDGSLGSVSITEDSPGYAGATINAREPAEIVFSETDYPGWEVRLDDRRVALKRFDGIFMTATVPAGRHDVVFKFNPFSFWAGLALTLGTIFGVIILRLHLTSA